MKAANDRVTLDLLGDSCDLAGPVPRKPTKRERNAARLAKYREKNGLVQVTYNLPAETVAALNAWFANRVKDADLSKSQVIDRLIRQQLLRKR